MSQVELGFAANLSSMLISRIERRVVKGSPSTQAHLAAALGTTRAELFPT
jgi:transcriptional regulator with XRE-family HTH domain